MKRVIKGTILIAMAILMLFPMNAIARNEHVTSKQDYGYISDMIVDGNNIVAAVSDGSVMKVSLTGDVIWRVTLDRSLAIGDIRLSDNGGYIAYGAESVRSNNNIRKLYKLNTDGSIAWQTSITSNTLYSASDISVADNKVYVIGTYDSGKQPYGVMNIYSESDGSQIKATTYYSIEGGFDKISGNKLILGDSYGSVGDTFRFSHTIFTIVNDGVQVAYKLDGDYSTVRINDIFTTSDGILCFGYNEKGALLFKVSNSGQHEWTANIGVGRPNNLSHSNYDEFIKVVETTSGYIAFGESRVITNNTDAPGGYFYAIYDKSGALQKNGILDARLSSAANGKGLCIGNKIYNCYIKEDGSVGIYSTDISPLITGESPTPTPTTPQDQDPTPTPDKLSGWQQQGSNWLYYENGAPAKGWKKIGNSWYLLDKSTGIMQTGWVNDGGWYYFKASGAMVTGWQKIGSKWYLFSSGGKMQTGWQKDGNSWYYLEASGAMKTGWLNSGGWYYLKSSGAMATGWEKIGNVWYWFDSNGKMATGTRNIGGKSYRFNSSGAWIA